MFNVDAKGLSGVQIERVNENTAALILTNTNNKHSGYIIGPEGLGILLEELLTLAATWVDQPDMKIEGLTGRRQALKATNVSIQKGRANDEAALVVWMGKLVLTFLTPLDVMVNAVAGMVKMIDPTSGGKPN